MLSYANLEIENANYVYPPSPGPQPNSPVCILLFYMTGRIISKFVPSDSFQVKPFKTMHVLSPIKEDLECCHNNIIQTYNGNQSLSIKMDPSDVPTTTNNETINLATIAMFYFLSIFYALF